MPFGTITSGSDSYDPRDLGVYQLRGLAFSDPDNSFVVRGGVRDPKTKVIRGSVSRILQKDVVRAGVTERKQATVTISIVSPDSDFTPSELDSMAADISTFITSDTVSRILSGEK